MQQGLVATADTVIDAPVPVVWDTLLEIVEAPHAAAAE